MEKIETETEKRRKKYLLHLAIPKTAYPLIRDKIIGDLALAKKFSDMGRYYRVDTEKNNFYILPRLELDPEFIDLLKSFGAYEFNQEELSAAIRETEEYQRKKDSLIKNLDESLEKNKNEPSTIPMDYSIVSLILLIVAIITLFFLTIRHPNEFGWTKFALVVMGLGVFISIIGKKYLN